MALTGLKFNTSFIKLGNIKTQPKPIAHVQLAHKVINLAAKNFTIAKHITGLHSIYLNLRHPTIHINPIVRFIRTPIPPVHTEKAQVQADNQFQEKFKANTTRFQPYENLTGISRERPEIVMLTEFLPIFDDHFKGRLIDHVSPDGYIAGMNTAGDFLDVQMQVANLQHYNVALLIEKLKNDDQAAQELKQRQQDFFNQIQTLTNHSDYLYQTVNQIEQLRNAFNTQDQSFIISWEHIAEYYFNFFLQPITFYTVNQNYQNVTPSILLSRYGYAPANIASFASSKVYLQLLYEFDQLMRNFSYTMLNKRELQQAFDRRPVDILQHASPPQHIPINTNIASQAAPVYQELKNLGVLQVLQATNELTTLNKGLLASVNFPTLNDRAAFLATLLSKEYRYSSSLAHNDTKRLLEEFYAYQVNTTGGNTALFDFIVGRIGAKITNIFAAANANTLTAAAQFTVNNVAVLAFEDSYIENDGSVFTPGTDYLVESMLSTATPTGGFATGNLDNYISTVNNIANRFAEAMAALRCFQQLPTSFELNLRTPATMESPEMLLDYCYKNVLDVHSNAELEILNDPMSGIANLAINDPTLKSLLFMYFTLRASSGNFENVSHVLERVIANIISRVQAIVPDQLSNLRLNIQSTRINQVGLTTFIPPKLRALPGTREYDFTRLNVLNQINVGGLIDVPEESIVQALRHGSPAITAILNVLNFVDLTYTRNLAYSNDLTLYSQLPHTTVQFLAFELMLSIMNATVNKRITGKFFTRTSSNVGKLFYTTTSKQIAGLPSVNQAKNKAKAEVDLTLQTIMGLIAMLRNVIDRANNVTNYLQGPNSIAVLNDITSILEDRTMVQQLITEQQIFMLKSIVDDLNDKLGNKQDQTESEINTQVQSQANDDIRFLDDTVVTTNVRNALFSLLGSRGFSGREAHNLRLLTVGVPQNFSKQLKEKVRLDKLNDKNFNKKALDVVTCNVYKVDVEYQDIIFKPQKFIFELSRFVARDDRSFRPVSIDGSILELLEAIPTTEYSNNQAVLKRNKYMRDNGLSRLFIDPEYSFLTVAQKDEMLRNHVVSFLLEIYIKFMTGVSTSEYNFFVDENQAHKNLEPEYIDRIVQTVVNQYNISKPFRAGTDNLDEFQIHRYDRDLMYQDMKTISTLGRVNTSVAANLQAAKKILSPKMFDRIFNVAVDPNAFEIDVRETQRTPTGKEAYHKLIQTQMVYTLNNQLVTSDRINQDVPVKIQDRHRVENHVIFEKYFVTFETVLQTEV